MICTTTPSIEGRTISAYRGILVAEVALSGGAIGTTIEVVDGLNLDLSFQTGRFEEARSKALENLEEQATARKADAIVGLRFEYVTFGKNGILNMVSAYGTAVCLTFNAEERQKQLLAAQREKASYRIVIDGKERGPFSIEQLSQLVANGRISAESDVRAEDSDEPIKLASLLLE